VDNGDALKLQLLGAPSLSSANEKRPLPAKAYLLVALTLLARSGQIARETAASLLWPDKRGAAAANLRQLLVRVRRAAGDADTLIEARGKNLFPGSLARSSDLATFLELRDSSAVGNLIAGVPLFRGDLLEGVNDASGELAQWLLAQRAALRESGFAMAERALIEVTRFGVAAATDIRSIEESLLGVEPERTESYLALIEAYRRVGDRSAVERVRRLMRTVFGAFKESSVSHAPAAAASIELREKGAIVDQDRIDGRKDRRPRVAIFPPTCVEGLVPNLYRALLADVADGLSRYRTFVVLAPHSSYAIADGSAQKPASLLDADFHVSSALGLDGEHLALRLTHAESDQIVWAARYSAQREQLRLTFRHLSRQIVESIAHEIERSRLLSCRVERTAEAYLHFLRGMQHFASCDLPVLRRARASFRAAAAADDQFGEARGRIAQSLLLEWLLLGGTDPFLLQRAKVEANAAASIDPGGAIGHWMRAVVALYQRQFDLSADLFMQAEALSPHSADLLVQHADALAHFGEPDVAWQRFEQAISINPLPPDIYWWAGAGIAFSRSDFVGAIGLCRRMKSDIPALRLLTASHALVNDLPTARSYARRLKETYPGLDAREMLKMRPDRRSEVNQTFLKGLRLAGIN